MPKSLFIATSILLVLPLAVRAADEKSTKDSKAAASASADASKDSAKADDTKLKGRLPNYYNKVGLNDGQKQKIYGLQASYASQIEELQKKLTDLEAKRDSEIRGVLTADQQKKLEDLSGDASKAKAAKKEAKSAAATDSGAKSAGSAAKADASTSASTAKSASK